MGLCEMNHKNLEGCGDPGIQDTLHGAGPVGMDGAGGR